MSANINKAKETLQTSMFARVIFSFTLFFIFILNIPQLSAQVPSYNWGSVKIGGGGYVTGIVIHPKDKNTMYIRCDVGGAYRWNAKNKQWEQMLNWVGPENANLFGVDGMALDANKPNRIYLALGKRISGEGGVYRSDDRGHTWTKLMAANYESNGKEARWIGECLAVDPNSSKIIYAGTHKTGLWQSRDEGKTFVKVSDIPNGSIVKNSAGVRAIVFDPIGKVGGISAVIYVGVPGSGVYASKDCGISFSLMEGSPKNPARMQVVNHELFVTYDKGVTFLSEGKWNDITPEPGKNYCAIAVDESDSRKIVATERYSAFYNPMFRSVDKGKIWEQINTKAAPANLNVNIPWWPQKRFSAATAGMAFVPGGKGELYYTDWFGVWNTPNVFEKTTEWYTLVKGLEETVILTLVSPPSGAGVLSGMADDFGFRHVDPDAYPQKLMYPLNECFSIAVCEKQPANIALLGSKTWGGDLTKLVTSSDFGVTFTDRTLPEGSVLGKIAVSVLDPNHMIYVTGKGKPYYSHDGGMSWKECLNVPENLIKLSDVWNRDDVLAADMVDGSFYILNSGIMYKSVDGINWSAQNTTPISTASGYNKSVVSVPGHQGELWVCLNSEGLWRTTDAGKNFIRNTQFEEAKLITWGASSPGSANPAGYCYGKMGGKWGIYRTFDMGVKWERINDDQHQFAAGVKTIAADRNLFGRLYIGTGGSGVLYGDQVKSK